MHNNLKALLVSVTVIAALLFAAEQYLNHLIADFFRQQTLRNPDVISNLKIHIQSSDPRLIYELNPNSRVVKKNILYEINPQGFRDQPFDDFSLPDSEQQHIVVLGDSVAWGWDVDMADAWPQRMEQLLNDADVHATPSQTLVYNLAVNGYSTQQEVAMLESRGMQYAPNLVILNYALNDPVIEEGGMIPYFQPIDRVELLYRSKLFVAGFCNQLRQWLGVAEHTFPRNNPWDQILLTHQAIFRNVEKGFLQLNALQNQYGFRVIVVVTPWFDYQKNEVYPWAAVHEQVRQLSLDMHFEFVDTQPALSAYDSQEVSVDLIHPNPKGHHIIAETLVEYLKQHPIK